MFYYYDKDNQIIGPFNVESIKILAANEVVKHDTVLEDHLRKRMKAVNLKEVVFINKQDD